MILDETYNILIENRTKKQLNKLNREILFKIYNAIKALKLNPRPRNVKKLVGLQNCYRIRIGNYRILYTVDDKNKCVTIYKVLHRKDAYR